MDRWQLGQNAEFTPIPEPQYRHEREKEINPVCFDGFCTDSFLSFLALSIRPARKVANSNTKTNGANIINPVTGVGSGPKIQKTSRITT